MRAGLAALAVGCSVLADKTYSPPYPAQPGESVDPAALATYERQMSSSASLAIPYSSRTTLLLVALVLCLCSLAGFWLHLYLIRRRSKHALLNDMQEYEILAAEAGW